MLKEVIVLAGGLGTRLKSVVKDVPKPMANINGKPFLEYILNYLKFYNIEHVILAVGYKSNIIKEYFGNEFENLSITYSEEKELLGTGGAIKQALNFISSEDVLILNGDTFFNTDLKELYRFHKNKNSDLTLALKEMENFDRYGVIEIDKNYRITAFLEKKYRDRGLINGGVYLLNKRFFQVLNLPKEFSFEKDFMEKYYKNFQFYGTVSNSYFIDIGIPEDYERAKRDFKEFKY